MPKLLHIGKGLSNVLFWSVISAAFIGPGTVTTASKAGAGYGLSLLWALAFSVVATIVLQEAAARITLASGKNLGEIIALKYSHSSGRRLCWMLFIAVAFGCAAYQAGNIVGAVAGLRLFGSWPGWMLTLFVGLLAFSMLWQGSARRVAQLLGMVVALMGIAFISVAFKSDVDIAGLIKHTFIPSIPAGAGLLVIGLVGTTIVPYNLFLASGIGQGQSIQEMRQGIALAVLIGGIISGAIVVAGTLVQGDFSFGAVAVALNQKLGSWGGVLFGFGLFSAGLSSAVTAPLAAAVTAQSLLGEGKEQWGNRSIRFRAVWLLVLAIGLGFGLADFKPIPVIILAQAVNGVLLPAVAVFLLLAINDSKLVPATHRNGRWANLLGILIVGITVALGLHNLLGALGQVLKSLAENDAWRWPIEGVAVLVIVSLLGWKLLRYQ